MEFLIILALNALAIFALAVLLPGIYIKNFQTAVLLGILLAFMNIAIGPVIKIVSLPLYLLISGLSYFIINALFLILTDKFLDNFEMKSVKAVILFSFILSILNGGLQYLYYR